MEEKNCRQIPDKSCFVFSLRGVKTAQLESLTIVDGVNDELVSPVLTLFPLLWLELGTAVLLSAIMGVR
ncbi:hypothetical protein V6N13_082331 [Hibiscus sabdariffa]